MQNKKIAIFFFFPDDFGSFIKKQNSQKKVYPCDRSTYVLPRRRGRKIFVKKMTGVP